MTSHGNPNTNAITSDASQRLLRLVALLALFSTLAQIIDGAIPQLRMAVNGGGLGGDFIKFKILLIVAALVSPMIKGYELPSYGLFVAWTIFIGCLVALSIAHMAILDKPIIVSWIEYFDNYSLVILLPILYSLRGVLDLRQFLFWMVFCLLIVVALGLGQFATSDPLVRVVSTDGAFMVNSWTMNGHIRAFSLFTSGLRFGYFCALMLALSLAMARSSPDKIVRLRWWMIGCVAMVGAVTTLTRNVYLLCLVVVFASGYVARINKTSKRSLYFLPIWCWLPFALVAIIAPLLTNLVSRRADVLDSGSLSARLQNWGFFAYEWLQTDVLSLLLGTGQSQMSRFSGPMTGPVVDNVILGVGLHIGAIGLASFFLLVAAMWIHICKSYFVRSSPTNLAFLVLWSTFLGVGMLNSSQIFYLACYFLFVLVRDTDPASHIQASAARRPR